MAIISSFILLFCCHQIVANPVVNTTNGAVEGREKENINSFKGIPYAAPPTGSLRWAPPTPPEPWKEPLIADDFGHACPQPERLAEMFGTHSEDCLTLNIWAPKNAKKAPVMVWIHGGAFILGKSSTPWCDGSHFAENGIVLVSINYRLGHLGFFHHPELAQSAGDQPLGNYGLMDQIAALEWVRDNISRFGGNPNQVTIFGGSAGGGSVLYLMIAERAMGLFHQAIVQSCGYTMHRHRYLDKDLPQLESLASIGKKVASSLGVSGDNQIEQLRTIPADEIIRRSNAFAVKGGFGPVIDGKLLKEPIYQAFLAGRAASMPLMIGANSYEASLMKAVGLSTEEVMLLLGQDRQTVGALYEDDANGDKTRMAELIFGDAAFVAPARAIARIQSTHAPTYLYHFDFVRERAKKESKGANHGAVVPMVFDALDALPMSPAAFTNSDRQVAETMHAYWVNFGKVGNPNANRLPEWPRYSETSDELLLIDNEKIEAKAKFRQTQLDAIFQAVVNRVRGD